MDTQEKEFSHCEFTHQSVNAQIKLATEPFLRQVEKSCACLAKRYELDITGNNEATGSRRDEVPVSSS